MKALTAAIFKLCTANGIHNEEAVLSCFDKYVNCSIRYEDFKAKDKQKEALKKLEKCKGK